MSAAGTAPKRFDNIEGARGIAALMVFLSHLNLPILAALEQQVDLGKAGVVLFFFVSGFLVLPGFAKRANTKEFVVKRFFRLYPVYWLSIILALLLMSEPVSTVQVLANLTMFQEFLGFKNLITVYWTLTIEMGFYVSLVIVALLNREFLTNRLNVSFHVTGIAAVLVSIARYETGKKLPLAMFLALFIMVLGAILRNHLQTPLRRKVIARYFAWFTFYVVTCCSFGYSFATQFNENPSRYICSYAFGTVFFVTVLWKERLFCYRPLLVLGQLSYGFYVFHSPILEWLQERNDSQWVPAVGTLLIGLPLSFAAYQLVELPSISLGRHVLGKLGMGPPAVATKTGDSKV